jgi:ABC-type multidrug transport system fused ATPase/permease subunit
MPQKSRFEAPTMLVLLVAIVVILQGALWAAIVHAYPKLSDRAEFGELFGGINTLFAGLAFAALVVTLVLQRRALGLQQTELEDQRREISEQNLRQEKQAFETMLVQMLSFHHEIAKETRVRIGPHDFEGRTAFRQLADELSGFIANRARAPNASNAVTVAQEGYEAFHQRFRGVLDHYFRNLYHIVKIIDQSGVREPKRYTSLVRAQLSPSELTLLFYNGLSVHGEKFKPLIEKYSLLEQFPDAELQLPGLKPLYDVGAYGQA